MTLVAVLLLKVFSAQNSCRRRLLSMTLVAVLLFKVFSAENSCRRPLYIVRGAVCSKAVVVCCRQRPRWRRSQ